MVCYLWLFCLVLFILLLYSRFGFTVDFVFWSRLVCCFALLCFAFVLRVYVVLVWLCCIVVFHFDLLQWDVLVMLATWLVMYACVGAFLAV